ncbi:transketolase, partial [Listeria monocytogenes]|nr:transketolase [Listeria monocytogenes]
MNRKQMEVVNNIRCLVAETVEHSGTGHPGMGMGAAGIGYAVWKNLNISKEVPLWGKRDRLIFSAGHGIVLQYVLLYLNGYISLEELKTFRTMYSKLPGLSEYKSLPYIESTTGSLGQGIANAVGMAISLKRAHETKKVENKEAIQSNVYCIVGDGCLMEGISYEASSLAGTLALSNLIVLYDSNNITIDGPTDKTFNENIEKRFTSMNWDYLLVKDGDDVEAINDSIQEAKLRDKPVLIEVGTRIARSSLNKENSADAHGKPLGKEEVELIKQQFKLLKPFEICEASVKEFTKIENQRKQYQRDLSYVNNENRGVNKNILEWNTIKDIKIPDNLTMIEKFSHIINRIKENGTDILVGSADLAASTKLWIEKGGYISKGSYLGANIAFGIRESAMAAIATGIYQGTCLKTLISTYFAFSDIMKNPIRMSALMNIPNIYVFTHDGFSLGLDGGTHIPVEQINMLRDIPNLNVYRPGNDDELKVACYESILNPSTPSAIILTRDVINIQSDIPISSIKKGGYLFKSKKNAKLKIFSTGSELAIAIEVQDMLNKEGIDADVISIPCHEKLMEQSDEYISNLFLKDTKKVFIEIGGKSIWPIYGDKDSIYICLDNYVSPGPPESLKEKYGYTPKK